LVIDILLLCPTAGIWGIVLIMHYLNYKNNQIIIGPKSVVLRKGTINVRTHEIRYSKINSITVAKSIFTLGTITIFSGNDVSGLQFSRLDDPHEVKRDIDNKIEENS